MRLEGSCRCLQVKELAGHVQRLAQQGAQQLRYDVATVTRLQPAGMGDRWVQRLASALTAPFSSCRANSWPGGPVLTEHLQRVPIHSCGCTEACRVCNL
jgi:hypothetical protein